MAEYSCSSALEISISIITFRSLLRSAICRLFISGDEAWIAATSFAYLHLINVCGEISVRLRNIAKRKKTTTINYAVVSKLLMSSIAISSRPCNFKVEGKFATNSALYDTYIDTYHGNDQIVLRLTPTIIIGYFHAWRNNIYVIHWAWRGNISTSGHWYADGVRGIVIDCGYTRRTRSGITTWCTLCTLSSYFISIKEPASLLTYILTTHIYHETKPLHFFKFHLFLIAY